MTQEEFIKVCDALQLYLLKLVSPEENSEFIRGQFREIMGQDMIKRNAFLKMLGPRNKDLWDNIRNGHFKSYP